MSPDSSPDPEPAGRASSSTASCRSCGEPLRQSFADLGLTPLANAYVRPQDLWRPEPFFPLHALVCERCFLVQVPEVVSPEAIFSDYAYFSSYADTWRRHAEDYARRMTGRLGLGAAHRVVEVASNDGYLLRYFQERGIPVLGVEPATNVARTAEAAGIPTLVRFFSLATAAELAAQGKQADLLVANNVLAHVPALLDFVDGLKTLLRTAGVLTVEFPHLVRLVEGNQFDTIYHEHFSYFSFTVVEHLFSAHGLRVFEVEELPTHGGSLRVYAHRLDGPERPVDKSVPALLESERASGYGDLATYDRFAERVKETKRRVLEFLIGAKRAGKSVAGYGAPAKGNTLLNYCGIGRDFLDYTVDRSPHKQGLFLPGSRIPVRAPDEVRKSRPDYLFLLPWNLRDEIVEQMADVRSWGGKFVVPIPEVEVID